MFKMQFFFYVSYYVLPLPLLPNIPENVTSNVRQSNGSKNEKKRFESLCAADNESFHVLRYENKRHAKK